MTEVLPQLICIDRDDTIVVVPRSVRYQYGSMPIEFVSGAAEFIHGWNEQLVPVVVVTNQQGVSNPLFPEMTIASVNEFNKRVNIELLRFGAWIDAFFVCPHSALENCNCRKPKPGLVNEAITKFKACPESTWTIGDKITDVAAGIAAGTNAILLGNNCSDNLQCVRADTFADCKDIIFKWKNDLKQ